MSLPFDKFNVLVKYAKLKSGEITPAIVGEVAAVLGFNPTAAAIEAATRVIADEGGNSVGQWLSVPENRERLKSTLVGERPDILAECPHCHNLIAFDLKTQLISG